MTRTTRFLSVAGAFVVASATFASNPAGGQTDSARIHLLHGIPDTPVDVLVGGQVVFEGFDFGDTQDISSFAGQTLTDVQVNLAGTDTTAIDAGDVELPASGNYTLIAHLDAGGDPTIGVFQNDTSAIAAGQGRAVVRHTAAAPAVDVLAGGAPVFTNVVNGQQGAADVPAGTVSASVVPTGETEPVVIGPADLDIDEGSALIVYAVGSLEGDSLTVLTESIDGLGSAPAAVNTGNSPINDSSSSTLPIVVLAAAVLGTSLFAARRLATVR